MIVPTVKMADEPNEFLPARKRTGKTQCKQSGFSTGTCETHALGGRDEPRDEFGPLDFQFVACAEVRSVFKLFANSFHHDRRVVPQQQSTVAARVVNVFVAVHVPFVRPVCTRHTDRVRQESA